jgi:diguanylate cyclase (GGDEF)-like protein
MECPAADIAVPLGTRLRIPRRTVLIFVLCVLGPALLGGVVAYQAMRIQLNAQVQERLLESARSYGLSVFTRLTAADQLLLQIAESAPANSALTQPIFTSVEVWRPGLQGGEFGVSRDSSALVAAATALKGPGLDSTVVLEHDESQAVPVLVRRLSAGTQAYAIGRLRTDYLWGNTEQVASDMRFCIGSSEGAFKYCSNDGAERTSAAGELVSVRWPLFLKARFGIDPWVVEAGQPRAVALSALNSLRATLLPLLIVTLGLALLFGALEMRRIFRPLDALLAALARLARGDFAKSSPAAGGEFRELTESLDLTAATLERQSDLIATLGGIDRKILSSDSLDTVIASSLPAVPTVTGVAGAALLLVTDEYEGEGMLYTLSALGSITRQACKLQIHSLQRVVEDDAPLPLSAAPMLPLASLREAGFRSAHAYPVRDGVRLIGALLLLDPQVASGAPPHQHALSLADRLSVAISHAHRKQDLLRSAYFDPLTGLANRELLRDRIGQALGLDGKRRRAALLLIGIDRFKNINDTLGHRAGDELLKLCAERLRAVIGSGDTIARLTGDEFIVLKPGLSDPAAVVTLAEAVAKAFAKPFEADGIGYVLSVSIGIAMAPGDGLTPDVLIRNADIAMRRAKTRVGGGVVFFEETMNEQAKRRFHLEHSLRAAWEQGEFAVHFQPKIELATGRVTGAEALLRWTHPTDGAIAPGDFIPIVEETGLIVPLGYWVIEQACRHLSEWRQAGLSVEHVAVNLSLRQLSDPAFIDEVARRVQAAGLPKGALELEVTETTVAEHAEQLPELLQKIRDLGVRIAIDDFGTGYSSLAMLQVLPIDVLKVDRAFVSAMEPGGTGDAIASAIIAMGRILGKELVAEGVETAAQAKVLQERGCPIAQGFYFSKALPANEFLEYCRERETQTRRKRYA